MAHAADGLLDYGAVEQINLFQADGKSRDPSAGERRTDGRYHIGNTILKQPFDEMAADEAGSPRNQSGRHHGFARELTVAALSIGPLDQGGGFSSTSCALGWRLTNPQIIKEVLYSLSKAIDK